jgi:hypothetical protein
MVVGAFALAGADPFLQLYTWLLALGTVGYLAIIGAASLAVISFFLKSQTGEGVLQRIVAPATATVGCAAAMYLALSNYDILTAGSGGVVDWLWVLIPTAACVGYIVGRFRGFDSLKFSDNADTSLAMEPDRSGKRVFVAVRPPAA